MLDPKTCGIGVYDRIDSRIVELYIRAEAERNYCERNNLKDIIAREENNWVNARERLSAALSEARIAGGIESPWFKQYSLMTTGKLLRGYENLTSDTKHEQPYAEQLEMLIEEWCGGPVIVSQ